MRLSVENHFLDFSETNKTEITEKNIVFVHDCCLIG